MGTSISNGHGGKTERSLVSSIDCKSSVDVTCTIDSSGLPCQNNLKVKRSDCDANGNSIPIAVTIAWKYCNDDNFPQETYTDKVEAKYKQVIKPDIFKNELIQPGQCVNLTRKVNINLCKSGATMSMKYEAHMPDVEGETYCYGYKFLKVRKQWLPEGPCSVTTNIACKMDGGDKANQDCSGNIVKSTNPNNCESIPVKWQYTYCFWNIGDNQVFDFTPQGKTWAKIKGDKISALDQTPLDSNVKCRFREESSTIDTCDDRTGSSIQVAGRYQLSADKEETCTSLSSLKVYAAATCQYNIIITEIIDPVNKPTHRYIEIYTPNCAGQVIIDDLWIVKYRRDKTNPSYLNPINLKGLEIPDDGFMVFCATQEGNAFYNGSCDFVTQDGSAADSDGRDNICIIRGAIDTDFEILDIFGKIGEDGQGSNHNFQDGRAVRKPTSTTPNDEWNPNDWTITRTASNTDADPGVRVGATKSPTKSPSKANIKSPTMAPTKSPTKAPTSSPTVLDNDKKGLTSSPTVASTSSPTRKGNTTKSPTSNSNTSSPTSSPQNTSSPTSSPTRSSQKNYYGYGKGKGKGKGAKKPKGKYSYYE